ncbi:TPA: metallophosphoesterase [Vibrio vulnificus]|nr:metallophosphoesterase [Vibrio vulnificus]
MAHIESNHIDTIFTDLKQYGLRGNSALWAMLKQEMSNREGCWSADSLVECVIEYTKQHIKQSLLNEIECQHLHSLNAHALSAYGYQANVAMDSVANEDQKQNWQWLDAFVGKILCNEDIESDLYIDNFNQGGMSGGGFDLRNWKNSMLPTIRARASQLEQGFAFREKHQVDELLFIGDVHGQVTKLDTLLEHYSWEPDDAKLVFVGDLIDNALDSGADHLTLLNKVKGWTDEQKAFCLLGNHEFNAVGWYLRKPDGSYCRDRNKAGNIMQHKLFLEQVGEDSREHGKWIEWFKTLPLFLNFGDLTAIHACWHDESIQRLRPYLNEDNSLKGEYWYDAFDPNHELYYLIETLLKGPEVTLPKGSSFLDKNGIERKEIRVAWWKEKYSVETYQDLAMVGQSQIENIPSVQLGSGSTKYNQAPLVPVIIGHYTLEPTKFPQILSDKVICVDFNAAKNENPLVSLPTWNGFEENVHENSSFCFVGEPEPNRILTSGILRILDDMVNSVPKYIQNSEFENYVAKVLLEEWDPISVYDPEYFKQDLSDEYSSYEESIARIAQAGSIEALAAYLKLTEHYAIGLERIDSEHRCSKVAYKLIEKWASIQSKQDDFFF